MSDRYKTCEDWLAAQPVSEFTGVTVEHVYAAWEYQVERIAELEAELESAYDWKAENAAAYEQQAAEIAGLQNQLAIAKRMSTLATAYAILDGKPAGEE
jgi:hypothetical protein